VAALAPVRSISCDRGVMTRRLPAELQEELQAKQAEQGNWEVLCERWQKHIGLEVSHDPHGTPALSCPRKRGSIMMHAQPRSCMPP
jgi:hypothetical protein